MSLAQNKQTQIIPNHMQVLCGGLACVLWAEFVVQVSLILQKLYITLLVFLVLAWMRTLMRALQLWLCCARAGKPTSGSGSKTPRATTTSPTSPPPKPAISFEQTEPSWGPSWGQRTTTTMCLQFYLVSFFLVVLGWVNSVLDWQNWGAFGEWKILTFVILPLSNLMNIDNFIVWRLSEELLPLSSNVYTAADQNLLL